MSTQAALIDAVRAGAARRGVAWPDAFEKATRAHLAVTLGLAL